jgi:hypothetical protein
MKCYYVDKELSMTFYHLRVAYRVPVPVVYYCPLSRCECLLYKYRTGTRTDYSVQSVCLAPPPYVTYGFSAYYSRTAHRTKTQTS